MSEDEKETVTVNLMPPNEKPTIDDLVGVSREFADELMLGIENEMMFNYYGCMPSKTFMINGPPGTGKTFTIDAVNNSINKQAVENFQSNKPVDVSKKNPYGFNMFFTSYDIGTHGTAYINRGSKIVQNFFNNIYHMSRVAPVFVRIDEADALLGNRKGSIQSHKEDNKVLETIMKNIQISHDTPNIYVAMMTNLIEEIDVAMLRAGRIDKHYTFDLPTTEERYRLFERIIQERVDRTEYQIIRNYKLDELAEQSHGFSNADIAAVIDKSLSTKARDMIKDKKPGIITAGYITQKRLMDELYKHRKEFKTVKQKRRIGYL